MFALIRVRARGARTFFSRFSERGTVDIQKTYRFGARVAEAAFDRFAGEPERKTLRRARRAAEALWDLGIRTYVAEAGFPYARAFAEAGLFPPDARRLYRMKAPDVARFALSAAGGGSAAILTRRPSSEVVRVASSLVRTTRGLAVYCGRDGDDLAYRLWRDCGASVLTHRAALRGAAVLLVYDAPDDPAVLADIGPAATALLFCDPIPALPCPAVTGARFAPAEPLEGAGAFDREALAAALAAAGALPPAGAAVTGLVRAPERDEAGGHAPERRAAS